MTNAFAAQWLAAVLVMGTAAIAALKFAHTRLHLRPAKLDRSEK